MSMPHRSSAAVRASMVALLLTGCQPAEDRPGGQAVPDAPPAGTETLVSLLRAQLTAPDPVRLEYRIVCEVHRVYERFGGDTAAGRDPAAPLVNVEFEAAIESAYRAAFTSRDAPARNRVENALANHVFPVGEEACRAPYADPEPIRG